MVKKALMDAKDSNSRLTTQLNSISNSYSGMKGKYSSVLKALKTKSNSLNSTIEQLQTMQSKYNVSSKKYRELVTSNATSLATMSKMKIKHNQVTKQLQSALESALQEAEVAKKEAQVLTEKIAEIEKNEKMARESSLTQAITNTRDFVFDNTIAGVDVSENQSRGLAVIAGAAVAAYMMTRVS